MRTLEKTTIIPNGNAIDVLGQPILKIVVLGDDEPLAQIANELAYYPPFIDRQVLWFKYPIEDELRGLFGNFDEDFDNIKGFSLSTKNVIADYITQGEIADPVRVELSYTRAGLPEFN